MSFWNELAQGFTGQPVMPRPVPEHIRRQIRRVNTWLEARTVSDFVADNFGNPPRTPVLKIPPSEFIGAEHLVNTFAYYLPTHHVTETVYPNIDKTKPEILVGTIRYRLWARSLPIPSDTACNEIPENCQNVFTVDCFCVDRRFRSKGRKIGTWLLKFLHYFANTNAIPYGVFMKEGLPVSLPIWPFRSGIYAWTKADNTTTSLPLNQLTENKALFWLQNYYGLKNNISLITNSLSNQILQSSKNPRVFPMTHNLHNAYWYLYRDSVSLWILIRVENTNQEHNKGGKIGYFTDVFISQMFNSDKAGLSVLLKDISNFISKQLGYSWIWLDSELVVVDNNIWNADGPYNWYAFQW